MVVLPVVWSQDGRVISWGGNDDDDDRVHFKDVVPELHDVQQIAASNDAFAAIRSDGHVITWGAVSSGGDSSQVRDELCLGTRLQLETFAAEAWRFC